MISNKDMTIKPTFLMVIFTCFQMNIDKLIKLNFIIDVGLTKGYQSSSKDNNKNSIGHLFSKFDRFRFRKF